MRQAEEGAGVKLAPGGTAFSCIYCLLIVWRNNKAFLNDHAVLRLWLQKWLDNDIKNFRNLAVVFVSVKLLDFCTIQKSEDRMRL